MLKEVGGFFMKSAVNSQQSTGGSLALLNCRLSTVDC
jgi:hypothetical protein